MHETTKTLRALRKTIGQNIHIARVKRKMTLQKLSRLTGIPADLLDQYELGKNEIGLEEIVSLSFTLVSQLNDIFTKKDFSPIIMIVFLHLLKQNNLS